MGPGPIIPGGLAGGIFSPTQFSSREVTNSFSVGQRQGLDLPPSLATLLSRAPCSHLQIVPPDGAFD